MLYIAIIYINIVSLLGFMLKTESTDIDIVIILILINELLSILIRK